jgi:asparagine synthase (glutamine-hydrolysing)
MFGWLIAKNENYKYTVPDAFVDFAKDYKNYTVIHNQYPKFIKDQFLNNSEKGLLVTEGVLLNSNEIVSNEMSNNLSEALWHAFEKNEIECLKTLCGPYCGFFQSLNMDKVVLFTNRVGDRPVYYYNDEGRYIASSNLNMIIAFCKKNNLSLSFNPDAGDMMLSYGFMLDGQTMAQEITRLFPGACLTWHDNKQQVIQYFMYDNTPDNCITEESAIENIDRLFRKAVKRCFDKDIEYGYRHLADLSGGLDSRMTNWVAKDLGYGPITNLNWGLPECSDFKIAAKVAQYLGNSYLFKSLAEFSCIYDVDEMTFRNFGAAIYMGSTGSLKFIKSIDTRDIGLKFTGQLGDVIIGSFVDKDYYEPPKLDSYGYSKVQNISIDLNRYPNYEMQKFYSRGFLGVTNSHQILNDFVVVVSPFLDNDLFEYCLKIPLKLRNGHYIYTKWILSKYPKAISFRRNDSLLSIKNTYLHPRISYLINGLHRKILRDSKALLYKTGLSKYKHRLIGMNPLDAIMERDPRIQIFLESYFREHVGVFSEMPEYSTRLIDLFNKGSLAEKTLVLTILSFVKQHQLKV